VAKRRLERLASSLKTQHPGAAASVKEGLGATLTLQRLGISGTLYKKLRSTNMIENLNSGIVTYSRNVKRWQSGSMVVRWTSAAIAEAEKKFRRVQGWRDIKTLITAPTEFEHNEEAGAERVALTETASRHSEKINSGRDNLPRRTKCPDSARSAHDRSAPRNHVENQSPPRSSDLRQHIRSIDSIRHQKHQDFRSISRCRS
jgi:hypothetical protein